MTLEAFERLAIAAVLGAAIGFEREADDHPAGVRTMLMVAVGASLFGIVSTLGFDEFRGVRDQTNVQVDVTRVASQVVVGMGFLGAGLVFRRGETVMNLTTAAALWVTAAIGLTSGVGNPGFAIGATVLALVALFLLPLLLRGFVARVRRSNRRLVLEPEAGVSADTLRREVDDLADLRVLTWRAEKAAGLVQIFCEVVARPGVDIDERLAVLVASPRFRSVRHGDTGARDSGHPSS